MKAFLAVSLIVANVLFFAGALQAASKVAGAENWNGGAIAWRDLPTGVREATVSRKPVIMVFQAAWCTACSKYRKVFGDPRIVDAARDFVMILIDVDKDKVANGAFSPDGTYVPRTIFLDFEGNIQSWLKGQDPKYPHTIDIEGPGELLGLMKKAKDRLASKSQSSVETELTH
jgi:protein-disulfide reductase (glutathione)